MNEEVQLTFEQRRQRNITELKEFKKKIGLVCYILCIVNAQFLI